ncbi:MAG: hypothetical protein KatS3mg096_382 [Candidatus Parcubacteria bacterium]|nr:MAG: hypothetical protein KatS3mg096_382 [Candidatus Parcubacteria bacterium]
MTNILLQYYQKYPFIFNYFDFLRDLLLAFQLILIFSFIFASKKWKYIFYYLSIFLFAFLVATFFKSYFPSLRPISYFCETQNLICDGLRYDSFPSRHTLISFASSLTLIFQNFKLGIFSLALTILIAILSLLSLRHWLIDVIFGFIFGFIVFWILFKLSKFFNWFDVNQRQSKA